MLWRKRHGAYWYLLVNSLMRSSLIEGHHVCFEESVELLFMKDEEVIQVCSPHAPQKAFADGIRSWRSVQRSKHFYACAGSLGYPFQNQEGNSLNTTSLIEGWPRKRTGRTIMSALFSNGYPKEPAQVKELTGERARAQGRIRQAGGGRKKAVVRDPSLQRDLEALLEPKGDPMSLIKWTSHSLTHLVKALSGQGHRTKRTALADVLHEQGYSLKVNKKTLEGTSHADRDQQFGHITDLCQQFEQKQAPAISVDCKKKELLGRFKNQGREWQPKGQQTRANVYDYRSLANGKAIPYGIYDLVHNQGFVNVGIDHETAEFAVESIRRWWKHCGKGLYPQAHELLITADGGRQQWRAQQAVEEGLADPG